MSNTSSPMIPSGSAAIFAEALAAAAERRTREAAPQLTAAQLAIERDRRQRFRRLLDPGIIRPNPRQQAMSSLKTLLTISENLLREPDNEKYRQFKPTNNMIKRELVDRKGALEYAIELGFKPEVINFQPYYTFQRRHFEELQIGSTILKEYLAIETEKEERIALAKKNEKAAHDAVAEKVKLAFMDDRKAKSVRDQIEREQRAGRAEAAARRAALEAEKAAREAALVPEVDMPGSGHVISGGHDSPEEMDEELEDPMEHKNR